MQGYVIRFCCMVFLHIPHISHSRWKWAFINSLLKTAWKKIVAKYTLNQVGNSVTKYTFAEVFLEAWIATVKMSTIINAHHHAGIWPVNPNHYPTNFKVARDCVHCSKPEKRKRPSFGCETCNTHICLDCFKPYHIKLRSRHML